jgi:murein DD-endopeptidase MepM/ murein hydrolase activator NlpD
MTCRPLIREDSDYIVQSAQSITLKFVKSLALLMAATASGCLQVNSGIPPGLQLPYLRYNNPASGVYHVVKRDESLSTIAKNYGVMLQTLAEVNNLKPPYKIKGNDKLFIPSTARTKKVETTSSTAVEKQTVKNFSGVLDWPVKGKIISEFGVRDDKQYNGIEIQADEGTPVKAAASGRVGYVGSLGTYGNIVLIEHPNRLVTVYGHLKEILVKNDAVVKRKDIIGTVGTSGRADVPSLYFAVTSRAGISRKKFRNPLFFLDRKPVSGDTRSGAREHKN